MSKANPFECALLAAAAAALIASGGAPVASAQAPESKTRLQRVDELSRVLGRAHYLRVVCAGLDDQRWRSAMQDLLSVEGGAAGSPRRLNMITAFNDGYRYEEERFAACTDEAREASRVLSAQGQRLADALAAQYRE